MKLYYHLQPKEVNKIISLANKGFSNYFIVKETNISKGKIKRCWNIARIIKIKVNLSKSWKDPH